MSALRERRGIWRYSAGFGRNTGRVFFTKSFKHKLLAGGAFAASLLATATLAAPDKLVIGILDDESGRAARAGTASSVPMLCSCVTCTFRGKKSRPNRNATWTSSTRQDDERRGSIWQARRLGVSVRQEVVRHHPRGSGERPPSREGGLSFSSNPLPGKFTHQTRRAPERCHPNASVERVRRRREDSGTQQSTSPDPVKSGPNYRPRDLKN